MIEFENKIYVVLDHLSERTESLWVEKKGIYYEIRNVPFFAYNISFADLIEAEEKSGCLYFRQKIKQSGHSTYRIFNKNEDDERFDFYMNLLSNLGCTYEKGTANLYSIDVPPDSDIYKVYEILQLGEERNLWEFEEGHCGHPDVIKSKIL